jgi:rod shape-determining protein MreC
MSSNPNSKLNFIYKAVSIPLQPVQKALSQATGNFTSSFLIFKDVEAVKQENKDLKSSIDQMKSDQEKVQNLEDEVSRLKSLLELKEHNEEYDFVAANIIAGDAAGFYNTFQIDRGTDDGVYYKTTVVTDKGLAGFISQAGKTSSKVTAVTDESNIIMARIARTNDLVRVKGMPSEGTTAQLKLDMIPDGVDIYVGDIIITAETGQVYPKGIVIGTVTSVNGAEDDETRYALVDPAVQLKRISEVVLMVPKQETTDNLGENK